MAMACRRELAAMADIVKDTAAPTSDRVAAVGACVKVRDQLLELLAIPRRPAAGSKTNRIVDGAVTDIPEIPEMPPQNPGIPS
jgi:hypothetical protein